MKNLILISKNIIEIKSEINKSNKYKDNNDLEYCFCDSCDACRNFTDLIDNLIRGKLNNKN